MKSSVSNEGCCLHDLLSLDNKRVFIQYLCSVIPYANRLQTVAECGNETKHTGACDRPHEATNELQRDPLIPASADSP